MRRVSAAPGHLWSPASDDAQAPPGRVRRRRQPRGVLEPGAAPAAVLVEHVWAGVLEDAVARTGGTAPASTFVESTTVADLGPQLLAAARSRRTSAAGR
jgi:hypothetical protein